MPDTAPTSAWILLPRTSIEDAISDCDNGEGYTVANDLRALIAKHAMPETGDIVRAAVEQCAGIAEAALRTDFYYMTAGEKTAFTSACNRIADAIRALNIYKRD